MVALVETAISRLGKNDRTDARRNVTVAVWMHEKPRGTVAKFLPPTRPGGRESPIMGITPKPDETRQQKDKNKMEM
jgi:hypothetical protein